MNGLAHARCGSGRSRRRRRPAQEVRVTCELLRSPGAEPLPQELEIADLSLGKLVAGVAAELHLDAEAADGNAGEGALAAEAFLLKGHAFTVTVGEQDLVDDERPDSRRAARAA